MMEFDYDYDVELFNYEDGVEVYSIHNYTCDHNISEDEIEDSIDTYYASIGYPQEDFNLVALATRLKTSYTIILCKRSTLYTIFCIFYSSSYSIK